MWTVPPREDPELRDDRLLSLYELQIQEVEVCSRTPYWDGHCGLVKVCDEDLVRPDAIQQIVTIQPDRLAARREPQQQQAQQAPGGGAQRGSALATATPGSSPRSASSYGASVIASPFKAPPGAAPASKQPAAVLTEQAAMLLVQQGRLHDAEALLHMALHKCPLTDVGLAQRIIDLLLEAERELQETPTHSRNSSELDHLEAAAAGLTAGGSMGGGGGGSSEGVHAQLRIAVQAMAAGEQRRAMQHLQRAQAACPDHDLAERRRIALYMQLVHSKQR